MKNESSAAAKQETSAEKQQTVKFEQMEVEAVEKVNEEQEELLGSVITTKHPGLRSSARFIKKVKRADETTPTTPVNVREAPAPSGRCLQKGGQRTKVLWSNLERNHFFDALLEFGKDYEAIANFINTKLKRRCSSDVCFKTKDQVRQHYYQTFHKLCKYMRFSDEVKKPVQELYALINYGEMRRKLQFVTDKHLMKLKHLVYQGHMTVRCKGKNIRIKTPSCKALRRINHLDDSLDDIKLPAKIDVVISPFTMEAFGRVQCVAQNPRVRTSVPLNKKLVNFIKTFQYKWRSAAAKLAEEEAKMQAANQANQEKEGSDEPVSNAPVNLPPPQLHDGEICFVTKPNVTLHRPLLSITDFLSSGNICLSAYEERMGVKVRGESLLVEKYAHGNQCKRMRTSSDCDKRSPDMKKHKSATNTTTTTTTVAVAAETAITVPEVKEATLLKEEMVEECKEENIGDEEIANELRELLAEESTEGEENKVKKEEIIEKKELPEKKEPPEVPEPKPPSTTKRPSANPPKTYKPLLDEETMRRVSQGWTLSTASDITVGDLYVVLGTEGRLELQYYWKDPSELTPNKVAPILTEKQNALPYNPQDTENPEHAKEVANSPGLSNRLKHLLLIANLSERMRRKPCSCGHICERNNNRPRTYISPKVFVHNGINGVHENGVFRQPLVPARRALCHMDPVKQLNTLHLAKSQKFARQVFVQRMLIPASARPVQEVTQQPVVGASMPSLDMDVEEVVQPTVKVSNKSKETQKESTKTASIPPNNIKKSNIVTTTTTSTTTTPTATAETPEPAEPQPTPPANNFAGSFLSETHSFNQDRQTAQVEFSMNDAEQVKLTEVEIINQDARDNLPMHVMDENSTSSTMSIFNSIMSPMHLIRDSNSNSRWLEDNLNDFSLTSLLGHLDEITNPNRDLLDSSCNLSVISETSVDYRHKFQEASALIQNQEQE